MMIIVKYAETGQRTQQDLPALPEIGQLFFDIEGRERRCIRTITNPPVGCVAELVDPNPDDLAGAA